MGDELYLPDVVVIRVMARRDLQRSSPKFPIHILVRNDGNPPAHAHMELRACLG